VRTIELLSAGDLARSNVAREEARAQRDADTQGRWLNALSSLIPAAADVGGKVYDVASENAVNDANTIAAQHADVMDQTEANDIVEANFKEPQNEDFLSSIGSRFTAPIRAKAKATAATTLSELAAKNTATRVAKEAADAKTARENARIEATTAAAKEKAKTAELARNRDDAVGQLRGAMQSGASRADLERIAGSVGMDPDALLLAADEAATKQNLAASKTTSEIEKNNAQAKKALTPTPGPSAAALDRQAKRDKKLDLEIAALEGRGTDPTAMRKEFNALPEVKAFNEVSINYDKMKQAVAKPTAGGDLALIFSFMKMLDPGSTVREGEFANAQNAGGVDDSIVNAYNKAISGERLNDEQRKDFLSQAGGFLAAQRRARDAAVARYSKVAQKRGIDAADVTGVDDEEDPFADQR
jgi:hypothetical protein